MYSTTTTVLCSQLDLSAKSANSYNSNCRIDFLLHYAWKTSLFLLLYVFRLGLFLSLVSFMSNVPYRPKTLSCTLSKLRTRRRKKSMKTLPYRGSIPRSLTPVWSIGNAPLVVKEGKKEEKQSRVSSVHSSTLSKV